MPAAALLLALLPCPPAWALDPPEASVDRGFHSAPFTLELTAPAGAAVVYGVGPGAPTEAWPGALAVDGGAIVRAQSVAADGERSEIATFTFLDVDAVLASPVIDPAIVADPVYGPTLTDTLLTLPTVSLVLSAPLSTAEQRASLEWIDPAGDEVQLDCGVRSVGGASLAHPKTNLRLNFRGAYGAGKLELDLYGEAPFNSGVPPEDRHDALNLRSGSHDSVFYLGGRGQYLRNHWMDETQLEMGHIAPHNRWAHLYLNGVYHGIYQVRERFDAGMMAAYLGGDEDDYEAINAGSAVDGSGAAGAQAVAHREDYAAVREWVNVENFLDYMILQFYAANDWDWSPGQNWMAAGPDGPGRGGFVFHSSDSDICLVYPWDYNLLHEPGPSGLFAGLMAESHPDFRALLADRIFLALEEGGPLTVDAAVARYEALAGQIEGAVVAESARWGGGWWDRDGEWVTERAALVSGWFPRRTGEQLRQFRAAGWYPLDAPAVSRPPGSVEPGAAVELSAPASAPTAEVWWRADGGDPRLPGGALAPEARGGGALEAVTIDRGTILSARLRLDGAWGPLRRGLYEPDLAPAVVLNEWSAVEPDRLLDDPAGDAALGRLEGNGGDWIELLVVRDHLDLRGHRLQMTGRGGAAGELTFADHPVLADLRSGTLITIAEDLPQDLAYDPAAGDWRFHLRAGPEGDGSAISAAPFDVHPREWQLTIVDRDGHVAFGPVGEGVGGLDGISGDEVGALRGTPGAHTRRDDPAYGDADHSSYGAPNSWDGGAQDLSALRSVMAEGDTDGGADGGAAEPAAPDTGGAPAVADSGAPADGDGGRAKAPGGCSAAPGAGVALGWLGLLLVAQRRRRALAVAAALGAACGAPPKPAGGGEGPADSGAGSGGAGDGGGDTGAGLACWRDGDGDGFGGPTPAPCADGVPEGGDCDDADPAAHPGAAERCDGRDEDCDGAVDDDPIDGLPFYLDEDGDGAGAGGLASACQLGPGLALQAGDCDDADPAVHPGAAEVCGDSIDQDCDGELEDGVGLSADCPALSCLDALRAGATEDGPRWLLLASGAVHLVACDQTRDGGGWTLGFVRNTVSTGSQGRFGAGDVDPEGLDLSDEEASDSADARLAWTDLNALDWTELRLTAAYAGARTYASEPIARTHLRIPFGEGGYLLYGEQGYYWCGGDASYTDSGVPAPTSPAGAPPGCRWHGSLGSGWDFSTSLAVNQGLTLCGGDASAFLTASWGGTWLAYGAPGGAQAIWVR